MLHVRDSQSLSFQCGAFTVLVLQTVFLSLIRSCGGQSEVLCPSQPVVAVVGEDIILPCYLNPAMNAFGMTVEWARPDLDRRFVLVRRDGVELESKKHPSYEGRSSLFTDELKHGNVSLKLSRVKISDGGRYRCFVPALIRASTLQLVVGAVSSPDVRMTSSSSGAVLQCDSEGWYPEPEVSWLDGEGHLLPEGRTKTVRGPDELYTVSSRVTVEKRLGNSFTCRVQQKTINQTRETQIHVPDHFFVGPGPPGPPGSPGPLGPPGPPGSPRVIIGSVIGCAALPAVVFAVWKWRQNKFKNKRRSLEEGTEQTEEEDTKRDKTGILVEMEGEGVPLMAGREEESNVDNRGDETIESLSEHEDLQFVAERGTHQGQLVTNPEPTGDVDRGTSTKNEKVIPTEGETHQKQDVTGRDKGEGEQTMKPVKADSGLPMVLVLDERENTLPSVCREVTERPDLKTHPETAERRNQELQEEKDLQAEKHQEETKEQPERSTRGVKKRREDGLETDKGAEGESVPLMAGREEESNVGNRGDETIESLSEHEDLQFVAERGTHQGQLVTNPEPSGDVDRGTSTKNEKVAVIQTEGETHQKQDVTGRDKGEGEQTIKPVKADSGLPMVLVPEAQKEQPQNLHTDQEEIRQETKNDVDKKETKMKTKKAKKENEQEDGWTGRKKQQENQREPMEVEAERQRVENENEKKLQSKRQKRGERGKNKTEQKTQKGNGNQRLLEDKKQQGSKTEHEDKREKDQEGNQRDVTRTTERTAEKQKKQVNEKVEETEDERDERENTLPSVCREVTERPDLKTHPETAERRNQELQEEKDLQADKHQEETKEQPERSTRGVEKRREDGLETDKGADETQKKSKEVEQQLRGGEGQQQAVREQPQGYFKFNAERQEEVMEVDRRPQTQRNVKRIKKQHNQKKKLHVDQQQTVRKRKHEEEEEGSVQTQKTSKKQREDDDDDDDDDEKQMEVVESQDPTCQSDQQVELMDIY